MHMTPIGTVHFIASLVALLAGAVVLLMDKGTRCHRTWGHAYVWGMLVVVATSFGLWNTTGRSTPFHFFAIVAGVTLGLAMFTVPARRPRGAWMVQRCLPGAIASTPAAMRRERAALREGEALAGD